MTAQQSKPVHFVLLHGAWHGGWCWDRTASILAARGHCVTRPTQTGLGERRHLLSADITLETFVDDVVNHIRYTGSERVVLVGHSFGGCAISGAAHRMADRIDRLIYLDSIIPISGVAPMSMVPDTIARRRIDDAEAFSGGVSMPCPPASMFDIADPDLAAWVDSRLTPHPLNTYLSAISFDGAPNAGLPATYIVCTDPAFPTLSASRDQARQHGWPVREIATGHDAMVTEPQALADLLEDLS